MTVGTFVEFQEKKRVHVGKIESAERKSSGGEVRYRVIDSEGHKFGVPDKAILYSMPCPNSPGQATKLYDEFCTAQEAPLLTLQEDLGVTSDLLEMVWEEAAAEDSEDHLGMLMRTYPFPVATLIVQFPEEKTSIIMFLCVFWLFTCLG